MHGSVKSFLNKIYPGEPIDVKLFYYVLMLLLVIHDGHKHSELKG